MNKSIFLTRKIPDIAIFMLENKGYIVDINPEDKILSKEELVSFLAKKPYDAVISLLTDKIDGSVFDSTPTVKIFSNYATGFDNIDVVDAKTRGIVVTNAPADLSAISVAQHAISFILSLARRLVEADDFMRQGKYKGWEPMNFIGTDLTDKTLALVGAGRIGAKVAFYAKGLGLKIIYTDVNKNEKFEKEYSATFYDSLNELLPQADFVSLHVPLLPSTKHLINEDNLKLMKKTSFLINTSRGPVVDEKALEKALREKIIAGAGLDVFEFEPEMISGLSSLPNIILTPHIASASFEARNQMAEIVAHNIIDFFEGRTLNNIVNK